jgi:uncharacterized coiled-coil DUF342 family protein
MDNTCGICFEEMDMNGYRDERQSTQTCFKLDCNHAFHTKCIVECLQKTHKECPSCNSEKTILEDLTLEGALQKLIEDVKKVKCVKESFRNCLVAKKDLTNTTNQLKKEIKEFAIEHNACSAQLNKFIEFIDNGDELDIDNNRLIKIFYIP